MSTLRVDFPAIGTTASVVATSPRDLVVARRILELELDTIDRTCSRFREDSDVCRLWRAGGRPVGVSDALFEAIAVARRVAAMTDGLVDPTIGAALVELGYDRDFAAVEARPGGHVPRPQAAPGWQDIVLDMEAGTVQVPEGVLVDLGATAKALVVDKAASSAAGACVGGVLVNVGGDLAVAGPVPTGGWSVLVAESHLTRPDGPGPRIAVHQGAVATSSTTVRRWMQGGRPQHHIVDPRTGSAATEVWRTVSVAASTCVDANAASTAALVLGADAPGWLAARRLPSRLVDAAGQVVTVAGWPADTPRRAPERVPAGVG